MEIYEVMFCDEYNNNYLLEFYKNLDDCIKDANEYLLPYSIGKTNYKLKKGDIRVYPSTMSRCFDTCIADCISERYKSEEKKEKVYEDLGGISIRGFILDMDTLLNEIVKLAN